MQDSLKQKLLIILSEYPETRDSDYLLYIKFAEHCGEIRENFGANYISTEFLRMFPESSVKRMRATIQNTMGLYPPTKEIKKRRVQLESSMKRWFKFLGLTR